MKNNRNYKLYIKDILDSIQKIRGYTKGMSYKEFCDSKMVIDAVIRNFEIIGEASKNIRREIKALYKGIPWKEMAGMGDKVIHEYFGVDLDIVWKTIKDRLPELEIQLKEIYKKVKNNTWHLLWYVLYSYQMSDKLIEEIRHYLNRKKISQEEFAHKIGVSFSTLNRWLNKKRSPKSRAIVEAIKREIG